MDRYHSAVSIADVNLGAYDFPLLDDEFDPDEKEIMGYAENHILHFREPVEGEGPSEELWIKENVTTLMV